MKAECRLFLNAEWPAAEPEWADHEKVNLHRSFVRKVDLPFMPTRGMYLCFGSGYEDALVKNVSWNIDTRLLSVVLEKKVWEPESEKDFEEDVADLIAAGWAAE